MINPNKYLQIVELIKNSDDLETVEAFLYNRGKIVIDKKDFYEKYDADERRQISEISQKPKRNPCILSFGGSEEKIELGKPDNEEEDENDYSCYR